MEVAAEPPAGSIVKYYVDKLEVTLGRKDNNKTPDTPYARNPARAASFVLTSSDVTGLCRSAPPNS